MPVATKGSAPGHGRLPSRPSGQGGTAQDNRGFPTQPLDRPYRGHVAEPAGPFRGVKTSVPAFQPPR